MYIPVLIPPRLSGPRTGSSISELESIQDIQETDFMTAIILVCFWGGVPISIHFEHPWYHGFCGHRPIDCLQTTLSDDQLAA